MASRFAACCLLFSGLALVPSTVAIFDKQHTRHVATYWGSHTSLSSTNFAEGQQRLAHYCAETDVDIIVIGSLLPLNAPSLELNNAGANCSREFSTGNIFHCPQLEEDIQTCQRSFGKEILLSISGREDKDPLETEQQAFDSASLIWSMFGPKNQDKDVNRPFGAAVVNGFDLSDLNNIGKQAIPFAMTLSNFVDAQVNDQGNDFYLTASPVCDSIDDPLVLPSVFEHVTFDFIMLPVDVTRGQMIGELANISACAFTSWNDALAQTSANRDTALLMTFDPATEVPSPDYARMNLAISSAKMIPNFSGVAFKDQACLATKPDMLKSAVEVMARTSRTHVGEETVGELRI